MADPAVTCTEMPGSEFGGCTTDMLPSGEESDAARAAGHLLVEFDRFDYTYYLDDLESVKGQWIEDRAFYPSTMTYSLTFVLGLLGNFLVVVALYIDRKAHNVTSSFMASLAIADILFLVFCVPYETAKMFMFDWVGGLALCKLVSFVEMLSALASVLNLTAVSVERYIVIVHPMKSRSWCTMGNTYKTILGIWIIAVLLSSPTLHIMKTSLGLYYNNQSQVTVVTCGDNNVSDNTERIVFAWYQLLVTFIIPILIILYCYSIVIRVLWISTREHAQLVNLSSHMTGNDVTDEGRRSSHSYQRRRQVTVGKNRPKNQNNDVREARKQIIRMLMTIVAIFFCCWGPKLVLNVMKRHQTNVLHNDAAFFFSLLISLLPYIQSCMNPVIYCFMSNKFRRSMRTTCRCRRRCCCSGEGGLPRDAPVTDGDLTSLNPGRGKLPTAAGASQSRTLMSQTDYSSSVLNPEYSPCMDQPGRSTTYISVVSDY